MKRYAQALAYIFGRAQRNQLVRQIQYLQTENRILRSKLPKRIQITPAERATLLKFGKPLGSTIRHLIAIVHPRTFTRWKAEERDGGARRRASDKGESDEGRQAAQEPVVFQSSADASSGLTVVGAQHPTQAPSPLHASSRAFWNTARDP